MNTKLIVLRGPSASGKSTVAKEVVKHSKRKVAWLEEDYFRRVILQAKEPPETRREICKKMLTDNTQTLLRSGFDVILEGMLSKKHYTPTLRDLIAEHGDESYLFHFNVSLDETLRRHRTKAIADDVSESQLREWYGAGAPLGINAEVSIPESYSQSEVVEFITRTTGL